VPLAGVLPRRTDRQPLHLRRLWSGCLLARGRWAKGDTEPAWHYGLDQVVRELLAQHGDLPLLAADRLQSMRPQRPAFLWVPELLVQHAAGLVELDIYLIIDGRVVVGEAKSNGRLGSSRHAAARMVQAAQMLTADEIVLATSQPAWAPGVRAAIAVGWQRGPIPRVIELTGLGSAS
jgi:hypothetical protein